MKELDICLFENCGSSVSVPHDAWRVAARVSTKLSSPRLAMLAILAGSAAQDVPGNPARFGVPTIATLTARKPDHTMRLRLISPCAR